MLDSMGKETRIGSRELTEKDLEKLDFVRKSIAKGDACTYDKDMCLEYLESILNPRCSICRKPLEGAIVLVKGRKMHPRCRNRYRG